MLCHVAYLVMCMLHVTACFSGMQYSPKSEFADTLARCPVISGQHCLKTCQGRYWLLLIHAVALAPCVVHPSEPLEREFDVTGPHASTQGLDKA